MITIRSADPFSRPLHGLRLDPIPSPAVNCWAIFNRPLKRGLNRTDFLGKAQWADSILRAGSTGALIPTFKSSTRVKDAGASGIGVPRNVCPSGISPLRSSLADVDDLPRRRRLR